MDGIRQLVSNLRALPPARQAILGATTLGSLAFFLWLSLSVSATDYRPLYRGIDPSEASSITEALREEGIAYELDAGGTTILVPAESLHEARIRVAGRGLPGGASTGFELFDAPAFGVSDFVHRVNFVRAIQGELSRTIEQLEPVERARVQVVIPESRSVLAASERAPSASVVVALRHGWTLEPGQVQAVVHLVASSIEGMDPEAVTVVDGAGRLLAPRSDDRPGTLASGHGPSYQARLEQDLARRIELILAKTVGEGRVVARVRADLDWTESETTEESFDPDGQVARSEQRSTERSTEGGAGGVAGAAANLPDLAGATAPEDVSSSRTTETVNYEISKTVRRSVTAMGGVQRLSIAVLVADKPAGEAGGEPQPWAPGELAVFESLARQAVGFDEERGDEITVHSAPFRLPDVALEPQGLPFTDWLPVASVALRGLLLLAALVLFAKLVVRPLAASVPLAEGSSQSPTLPARVEDLEAELGGGGAGAAALGAGGAASLPAPASGPNPEDGARALRNWLSQG